jgi:hypothetical protein
MLRILILKKNNHVTYIHPKLLVVLIIIEINK